MKSILAVFLTLAVLLPLALYASAADTPASVLAMEKAGETLLNRLLTRQFDALCTGENVYTADILAETEDTLMYREYLWWNSETHIRAELPLDIYTYDLSFVRAAGNTLQYTVDLSRWYVNDDTPLAQTGILYTIQLRADRGGWRITAIDTDETGFDLFKYKFEKAAETVPDVSTRETTNLAIYNEMLLFLNGNTDVLTPTTAGKHLLDLLLQKEYTARCTGRLGEWDDIFIDTPGTAHYKQFILDDMTCRRNRSITPWYGFQYDIYYAPNENAPDDTISYIVFYSNAPNTTFTPESMRTRAAQYNLTIVKTDGGYRIADITTDAQDFFLYEMCYNRIFAYSENDFDMLTELFPNLPEEDLCNMFDVYISVLNYPIQFTFSADWETTKLYSSVQEIYWWSIYGYPASMFSEEEDEGAPTAVDADNLLDVTEQYLRVLLTRACDARCDMQSFSADGILKGKNTYDYAAYLAADIQKCKKSGGWMYYDIATRLIAIDNDGAAFDVTIEYWSEESYLPMGRNHFTVWVNAALTEDTFYIREIRSNEPAYLAYLQKDAAKPYRELPLPHVPWFCAPVAKRLLDDAPSA